MGLNTEEKQVGNYQQNKLIKLLKLEELLVHKIPSIFLMVGGSVHNVKTTIFVVELSVIDAVKLNQRLISMENLNIFLGRVIHYRMYMNHNLKLE